MSPTQIIEAWEAHEIDAAFCWGDTFQYMKERGTTVVLSGQLASWGRSTFLILGVGRAFAEAHPAFVQRAVAIFSQLSESWVAHGADPPTQPRRGCSARARSAGWQCRRRGRRGCA